jgi:hypothetical protein
MAASREVYMLDSDSDDEAFTKYRGIDEDVGSEDESDDKRAHAHGPERMTNDSSDDDGPDSGFDNFYGSDDESFNSDFDDNDSSNDNDDDEEEGEYGLGDEDGSNSEEAELSTKAKWAKRRQQIINMLLDDNHDIHLLTGKTKSTVKGFGKSMHLSLTNLLSLTRYQDVVSSSLVKETQQKMVNRFGRVGAK